MARYLTLVDTWTEKLNEWFIKCVPLEENEWTDALAGVIADSCPIGVSADSCPAGAPWLRE